MNVLIHTELLFGQDINLNKGTRSKMFSDVIVTNGIDNKNAKGKSFLFLLGANKFRLFLSYFKHANYVTWGFFNTKKTPHIMDNFICDQSFFSG